MTMTSHQADGVFQGGGVKGIALAGALQEFADSTRHPQNYVGEWVKLAGTSAGAIVAAYLACGHNAEETATLITQTDFTRVRGLGAGRSRSSEEPSTSPHVTASPTARHSTTGFATRSTTRPSATSRAPVARSS